MSGLSIERVTRAKGFFCICVLLHHINQCLSVFDGTVIDLVCNQLGYLSVAAFLFFSGYGLSAQTRKRENYVKDMWKTRILSTYATYLIVAAVYFLTVAGVGTSLSASTVVRTFSFGGTVVRNGWYFQCQIVLYLLYYLAFRFLKKTKWQIAVLSALSAGYVLFCVLFGLEPLWYQSVFCFLLGVLWNRYLENSRKIGGALVASGIAFVVFFAGAKLSLFPLAIAIVCKALSALAFVTAVASFLSLKMPFSLPPLQTVLCTLGKYSMEIYAFHGVPLMLFRGRLCYVQSELLFVLLVLLCTAVLSLSFHPLFTVLNRFFKGVKPKNKRLE